jgi:hypothetical protein
MSLAFTIDAHTSVRLLAVAQPCVVAGGKSKKQSLI